MNWQPDQNTLHKLTALLGSFQTPDSNVLRQAYTALEDAKRMPDFASYMVLIFAQLQGAEQQVIRSQAGVQVKQYLVRHYNTLRPEALAFYKDQILNCVGDSNEKVSNIAGVIVAEVVRSKGLAAWAGLLERLVQLLSSNNQRTVEGTLSALFKVCEDCSGVLCSVDKDNVPRYGAFLDALVEKLLVYCRVPSEPCRRYSLGCMNSLLRYRPPAITSRFGHFLEVVFGLASDPSAAVKATVVKAMTLLVQSCVAPSYMSPYGQYQEGPSPEERARTQLIAPHFEQILQFVLFCTKDDNEDVARQACEFWVAVLRSNLELQGKHVLEMLQPKLPELIRVLLTHMIYDEEEKFNIAREDEEAEKVQDTAPRNFRSRKGNEDDDDFYSGKEHGDAGYWNVRRLAGLALDLLAGAFAEHLLPVFLPAVEELMKEGVPWDALEAGILALGAVSGGCGDAMQAYLPKLVPFLISLLKHPEPLLRNIVCWSLSRYSWWITEQPEEAYLIPTLQGLLQICLDNNRRTQQSGCSAISVMVEDSRTDFTRYINWIVETFEQCFARYGYGNLLVLNDSVATYTETCAWAIKVTPQYVELYKDKILQPMVGRWFGIADDDKLQCSLAGCIGSVIRVVGVAFEPLAPKVFQRCLQVLDTNLVQMASAQAPSDLPDPDFTICMLDLIASMGSGLKEKIEPFVANSNLLGIMYQCMKCNNIYVRQSVFALLGDIAAYIPALLVPKLDELMKVLLQFTKPIAGEGDVNNATWALGCVLASVREHGARFYPQAHHALMAILTAERMRRMLLVNTTVSMARLSLLAPEILAPHLERYVANWCVTTLLPKEASERELSARGVLAAIQANPQAVFNEKLSWVCKMISKFANPPADLAQLFNGFLHTYKQNMGEANWTAFAQNLDPEVRDPIQRMYGV